VTTMRDEKSASSHLVTVGFKVKWEVRERLRRIAVNRGVSVSALLREQTTGLLEGGAGREEAEHCGDGDERYGGHSECGNGAGDVPVPRHDLHDRRAVGPARHPRAQDAHSEPGHDARAARSLSDSSDKVDKEVSQ